MRSSSWCIEQVLSLLEVHVCGSPAVEACFDARFSENVFCELCIGVSFFLRFMQWMRVPPFSYFCVQWMRVPSFFYARHCSGLRRALPVEKGRELDLRVTHSHDVEL